MNELLPYIGSGIVLGLAGSLHCLGMCGPLLIAAARLSGGETSKSRSMALHHLGRITSYGLLGLTAGSLGQTLSLIGWQQPLTILLGVIILSTTLIARTRFVINRTTVWVGALSRQLNVRLKNHPILAHLGLGMCHGLLPCGLVYIALAAAAATSHPVPGTVLMISFGLGTLPLLLGTTAIQHLFSRLPPIGRQWLHTGLAMLAGMMLVLRGMGLGIPILSPKFSSNGTSACCSPSIVNEEAKNSQIP